LIEKVRLFADSYRLRAAALRSLYQGIDFLCGKPGGTQGDNFVNRKIDCFITLLVGSDGKANDFTGVREAHFFIVA
jgi:hypothetical protein